MVTVKVSSKFQVVIPKDVRKQLGLRPGKRYQVISFGDCIEFVPVRKIRDMKGFLKGGDSSIPREEDRL